MGFASIGSGSRGNGTLVSLGRDVRSEECNGRVFLVDCGFSLKQCEKRLAQRGLSGGDIDAILVSHEHADHISGVAPLAHKYSIPVYGSYGTVRKLPIGLHAHTFDSDVPFDVDGVLINPVCVPHDAREPTQFVLQDGTEKVGVLSDLGSVTQHVVAQFSGCTHLLLEANHDRGMLLAGSYPAQLKRRVAADYGHLSNQQALQLLEDIAHQDLHVVIGHVSEQNNDVKILQALFESMQSKVKSLQIATQKEGFDWLGVRPLIRQISFSEVL